MTKPLALVTGASGGIGSAVTLRLAQEGYHVLAIARTEARLSDLVMTAAHVGVLQHGAIQPLPFDVSNPSAWVDVGQRLTQSTALGALLTLVVVCHGEQPVNPPRMAADDSADRTINDLMDTDVLGALCACQCAYPFFAAEQRGCIVLVSSLHAKMTYPQRVPYCVAKAALGGMVRALAVEWGRDGVRVNALLPWQVEGPRTQRFIDAAAQQGQDLREAYVRRSPLRHLVSPNDIAETVLWLARTPSVTGQEIVLDCGVSASMWYEPFTGNQ